MSTPESPAIRDLPISIGPRAVPDRATFEQLARRDDVPGQLGAPEMKLLILGVDSDAPQLFFVNTNRFEFHHAFATRGLGLRIGLGEFNAITYFRDDRTNLPSFTSPSDPRPSRPAASTSPPPRNSATTRRSTAIATVAARPQLAFDQVGRVLGPRPPPRARRVRVEGMNDRSRPAAATEHRRGRRGRERWLSATLAVALVAALGGCGGGGDRSQGTQAGPATESHTSADAGSVALRYTQALFTGRFSQASRYVAPSSRNAMSVLTAGLGHSSVTSHDRAIGSTRVTGSSAVAILTGSLCSSFRRTSLSSRSSTSRHCASNTDAHTGNPMFRVQLERHSGGPWLVSFRPAPSGSSAPEAPATSSGTAP